jgi:hypothetical protein
LIAVFAKAAAAKQLCRLEAPNEKLLPCANKFAAERSTLKKPLFLSAPQVQNVGLPMTGNHSHALSTLTDETAI